MNWLDIVILLPACWFAFKGFKNGLVKELATLTALILGIWATCRFSDYVATLLGDLPWVSMLAFILTFVIVLILVYLFGNFVEKVVTLVVSKFMNRLFGFVFGVGKVLLIFSLLFFIIHTIDSENKILTHTVTQKSLLYSYVEPVFPLFREFFFSLQS
jgi:membrane protein required for colicin V production